MRYLLILQQSPYQSSLAREALDFALASAAFEQKVSLLFLADGVFQLLKSQAAVAGKKSIEKTLAGLELFDIEEVYACEDSLSHRAIDASMLHSKLCHKLKTVDTTGIQALIESADKVFNL